MPVRLILNADDFGLTPGINEAVIQLYQEGALTSTTLMATAPFAEQAIAFALTNPGLGVGCHVTLVDGSPAAPPDSVRTLLTADAKTFRSSVWEFAQAGLRGLLNLTEIALETRAQIEKLQRAGITVTHIDTHKHLHLFPKLARVVMQAARQCGVQAVRNPFEPRWSSSLAGAPLVRGIQLRVAERYSRRFLGLGALTSGAMQTTDGTLGIAATGTLDAACLRRTLYAIAAQDADTTWELCCHPGHVDAALDGTATRLRASREIEYRALLQEVPEIVRSAGGPALIHYGALGRQAESGHQSSSTGGEGS